MVMDNNTQTSALYSREEVDRIVTGAVECAIQKYEERRLSLEMRRKLENIMLLAEKAGGINSRKKRIDGGNDLRELADMLAVLENMVLRLAKTKNAADAKNGDISAREYMMEWYRNYKEPQIDKNTATNYLCMMNRHIFPVVGDKSISDISVADVQGIMSRLKSASRAKQVKSILNLVIEAAIADEIYHHPNPCKDKRIVMPTARRKREALGNDDLSRLIAFLPSLPEEHARILVMLIMTGCRRGEALGARWEDIDWEQETIHLQRVVRFRNNRPEVSGKMKTAAANRTVSLWREFIPYLGKKKEKGFIIHRDGEPLSERMYRNRWEAIMKQLEAAGLEKRFTAHQLRHTYATVAANSGNIPPKVLQGMLGHASFQTTMNIYAGLDAEKVREGSQNLADQYARMQAPKMQKTH